MTAYFHVKISFSDFEFYDLLNLRIYGQLISPNMRLSAFLLKLVHVLDKK